MRLLRVLSRATPPERSTHIHLPLETERLLLRPFRPEDAKPLYRIRLEPAVKQWLPNESYADLAETEGVTEFFSACVTNAHLPYVLAIELKETGELIGDTGMSEMEGAPSDVKIGYVITEAHADKGYASEAARAMTRFTAEACHAYTFWGRVVKGNTASSRVLEKTGYTYLREGSGAEDDPCGMLVYRIDL